MVCIAVCLKDASDQQPACLLQPELVEVYLQAMHTGLQYVFTILENRVTQLAIFSIGKDVENTP